MLIGEIAALSTALFWSIATIFFTYGVHKVGVFQINIDRLAFASIFLIATILLLGIKIDLSTNQYFYLVLSSVSGLVIGDTCIFKGFATIGPRITLLIMSLAPPVGAILAYFVLGETLSAIAIIGIMVTVSGISLVIFERDKETKKIKLNNKMGILWAIGGMLGQAGGLVLAKIALNESSIHPMAASFVRIFSGWVMLVPIGLAMKRYKMLLKPYRDDYKIILAPLAGSVFGPYLGITLSLVAINYTQIGIASTLMATTPILMLPISKIFFKEKLVWQSIVGAFIAVLGIALLFLK